MGWNEYLMVTLEAHFQCNGPAVSFVVPAEMNQAVVSVATSIPFLPTPHYILKATVSAHGSARLLHDNSSVHAWVF